MHSLVRYKVKDILEKSYIKVYFDRNSVCMGDDCNPHSEYIRFIAQKTNMLDIVNRLKSFVPYTGGKRQGIFTLSFRLCEEKNDFTYILGAYYETDEYSYSYAIEPQKTIEMILNNYYDSELRECAIYDYSDRETKWCDTSEIDGIPCFIRIYASVGTSGKAVPFEKLKDYLSELVNKKSES